MNSDVTEYLICNHNVLFCITFLQIRTGLFTPTYYKYLKTIIQKSIKVDYRQSGGKGLWSFHSYLHCLGNGSPPTSLVDNQTLI